MKIVCLIDNLGSGGAQRQLVNLSILWKKNGHDISFICYNRNYFYESYLLKENIDIIWIDSNNLFQRLIKVRAEIKKNAPDIVVSFMAIPGFIACFSSIGHHKWKLITNELSADKVFLKTYRSKVFKFFERFSNWTVCNSDNAKKMWNQYYPQYSNRISTIYNPVIIPEKEIIRAKNHKYSKKRTIVIAASYRYLKNPIGVVNAIKNLKADTRKNLIIKWYGHAEVTLGDTKAYDETVELIKQYNLENILILHNETENIYKEMAEADAIALFSKLEGLPNVICEGMMLGKPILMSKISDYSVLVDDTNGLLCEVEKYENITDVLEKFLSFSDEELDNMGKNSRKKAIQLFDPQIINKKWEELFLKIKSL